MHPMFHRHMLEAQAFAGKVKTWVRRERREGRGSRPVMPRFERGERLETSYERGEARGESWPVRPHTYIETKIDRYLRVW